MGLIPMQDDPLKTLLHPFETGTLDAPAAGDLVLVINAPASFRLPADWKARPSLVQDFRPDFLALQRAGHETAPDVSGDAHDLALVCARRHRGRNELFIADALARTRAGGRIVVAGRKAEGGASLRKRVAALTAIDGHASKNHGVVFWLTRPADAAGAEAALRAANPPSLIEGDFVAEPGAFSHDRVDEGSRLLVEALPARLSGRVADFGAGWGYLAAQIARRMPGVTSLDLFEASHAACAAARGNMARLAPGASCEVRWHDILSEPVGRRFDAIVMNPPFHQGRAAEPGIGQGFIRAASAALVPGGRLFLVANRELPYEAALQAGFARHGETVRSGRFKVLWAVR
jgi:16S rRNA (guanine1207-N2)-methyltransferase